MDHGLILNDRERLASGMEASLLAEGYNPVHPAPELFGLGIGGLYLLFTQKRSHHIAHHRPAVARIAAQLSSRIKVSHSYAVSFSSARRLLSISSRGGKWSIFMPSSRPISRRISLISLSDLWPKFLVFSISCSEFCTNSPMYLMSAFCNQ